MDTVAVFIDGSDFYNKIKELGIRHTSNFDYRGLAEWLAHGRMVVYCGYYPALDFRNTLPYPVCSSAPRLSHSLRSARKTMHQAAEHIAQSLMRKIVGFC